MVAGQIAWTCLVRRGVWDPRDERIAELAAGVSELKTALAKALARIAALEEKLRSNSTNSSNPPSSDSPSVKRVLPQPKGRKPGGQPGHSGHQRDLLPLERVSKVVELKPSECRRCCHWLHGKDPTPWRHQVAEIPRQLCWAHLLRDFICFSERAGASATLGFALIEETKKLLRKW